MGVLHGHFDQAQDRRKKKKKKRVQVCLLPVNGQGILGQIVGADAEEIYFFRQFSADEGCGRRFDHDTRFYGIRHGNSLR